MKKNNLIVALGFILMGILFIIFKGAILGWLMTILGAIFIIDGIISIINKTAVVGIIKIVIGAAIILLGWLAVTVILYILAVIFILYGILNLYNLISAKVTSPLLYLMPAMQLAIGICLFFNQGGTVNVVFIIAGICLIIDGAIELLGVFLTKE